MLAQLNIGSETGQSAGDKLNLAIIEINRLTSTSAITPQEVLNLLLQNNDTNVLTDAEKIKVSSFDPNMKVDKVPGKGLSSNDYTDTDKAQISQIAQKVDKIPGKSLSTNDFTNSDVTKLGKTLTNDDLNKPITASNKIATMDDVGTGGGAINLNSILDVDILGALDKQVLTYEASTAKWKAKNTSSSGYDDTQVKNDININRTDIAKNVVDIKKKEDDLGKPTVDDQVLTSKTDGTRIWVTQSNTNGPAVIDDLTTGGPTDALSAEQGKVLKGIYDNIQFKSASGPVMSSSGLIKTFGPAGSVPDLPELGLSAGDNPDFTDFKVLIDYLNTTVRPDGMMATIVFMPGTTTVDVTVSKVFPGDVSFIALDHLLTGRGFGPSILNINATNLSAGADYIFETMDLIVFNGLEINVTSPRVVSFINASDAAVALLSTTINLDKTIIQSIVSKLLVSNTTITSNGPALVLFKTNLSLLSGLTITGNGADALNAIGITLDMNSTIVIQEAGGSHIDVKDYKVGILLGNHSKVILETDPGAPKSTFHNLELAFGISGDSIVHSTTDDLEFINVVKKSNIPMNEVAPDGSLISTDGSIRPGNPLPSYSTANRPVITTVGYQIFDTDLNETLTWDGNNWITVSVDVINDLTSDETTKALSAEQGKVLKGLIDGIPAPDVDKAYVDTELAKKEDNLGKPTVNDQILSSKTDGTKAWITPPVPAPDTGETVILENYSMHNFEAIIEPTDSVNVGIGKLERADLAFHTDLGDIHTFVAGSNLALKLMELKQQVDKNTQSTSTGEQIEDWAGTVNAWQDANDGQFIYIDLHKGNMTDNPAHPGQDIEDGTEHYVLMQNKAGETAVPDESTWIWVQDSSGSPSRLWTNTNKTKAASAADVHTWIGVHALVKIQLVAGEWFVKDVHLPAGVDPAQPIAILSDGSVQMHQGYLPVKDGDVVTYEWVVQLTSLFTTKDEVYSAISNTFSGEALPDNTLGKNGDFYEKFPTGSTQTFFEEPSFEGYNEVVFYIYEKGIQDGLESVAIIPDTRKVQAYFGFDEAPKYTGMTLTVDGNDIPLVLTGTTQNSHLFEYDIAHEPIIKSITTSTIVKGTASVLTGEYSLYKKIDGVWKENRPYSRPTIHHTVAGTNPSRAECTEAFKKIFNYSWDKPETFYIHDSVNGKGFQVHYNPNGATQEGDAYEFWTSAYTEAV